MVTSRYMRAIFTHCIQFGFTYGMIYSTKAYLEAGDGNLLEAEVALKAKARCAEARRERKSVEERQTKREREKPREGQQTKGKEDKGYVLSSYSVSCIKVCKDVFRNADLSQRFCLRVRAF